MARMIPVLAVAGCLLGALLCGCPDPPVKFDVIGVSQDFYDFGTSRQPWNFELRNTDSSVISNLELTLTPSHPWIVVDPAAAISTGPRDVKIATVTIDRRGMAAGTYSGYIDVTAYGALPRRVAITMDCDGTDLAGEDYRITGVSTSYTPPYLLDFTFTLRDTFDQPVAGEPVQFSIQCREGNSVVSTVETPPYLTRATAKQLRFCLVLDYTASMASIAANGDSDGDGKSDAIENMEAAIKDIFLKSLPTDAQVAIFEFHRETTPQLVCGFTADKALAASRIDAIWTDYVRSYWGPSRCWDATYAAIKAFGNGYPGDENNNVILIGDARDTSSTRKKEDVIDYAQQKGVRMFCIGYGRDLQASVFQALTYPNGRYFIANTAAGLSDGFIKIIEDIAGQYALRWATLSRGATVLFVPSFTIGAAGHFASHTSEFKYRVRDHDGDELAGLLRTVASEDPASPLHFLRAVYLPRAIWQIRLFIRSPYAFETTLVDAVNGGLCAGWTLTQTPDETLGGAWVNLQSPNPGYFDTQIPFAAFGPILAFRFTGVQAGDTTPFDTLYVDNTLYTAGQSLTIDGWPSTPPQ